jgi:hypothetical protein
LQITNANFTLVGQLLKKTNQKATEVSLFGKTHDWGFNGKGGGVIGGADGNNLWKELLANMATLKGLTKTPQHCHLCPLCLKEFKERATASKIQNQHMFTNGRPAACDSDMKLKVVEMCNSELRRISSLLAALYPE